jgi:hypothetical protein
VSEAGEPAPLAGATAEEITLSTPAPEPEVIRLRHTTRILFAQEVVRSSLAFLSFPLLAGTVTLAFSHVNHSDWGNVKELLSIVVPAETALTGAATGFYFAGRSSGRGD